MLDAMGGQCLAESEEVGQKGVGEAQVMTRESPSVGLAAVGGSEGQREDTPDEGVVEDTDVVADGDETLFARLVVGAYFQQVQEAVKTRGLGGIEGMQACPAEGVHAEEESIRAGAPERARDFSVLIQVVIEVVDQHHEG